MLQVQDLTFEYADNPLFTAVQWSLPSGHLLHLCGTNGAGKTTLLRLLAGLLHPVQGAILWDGACIHEELSLFQRRLCYVGHKMGISLALTVKEHCFFDLGWQGDSATFQHLLSQFQLQKLADTRCSQLSEGQRRRVALLPLIMRPAQLWLLDEPWVALDEAGRLALTAALQAHLAASGLVVMTSHQQLPPCFRACMVYTL